MENWNRAANILSGNANPAFKKLPQLSTSGSCCGFSFVLAEFVRRGEEARFYELYEKICCTNPETLAREIANKNATDKQQEEINALLDFVVRIFIFSEKQSENPFAIDKEETEVEKWARTNAVSPNHARIGGDLKIPNEDFGEIECFEDLFRLITKLQENESYELGIGVNDDGLIHSVLIYKLDNDYHIFDSCVGKKVVCKDPKTAVAELTLSANQTLTGGTNKYTYFDHLWITSNAFKVFSVLFLPITIIWCLHDAYVHSKPLTTEQLKSGFLSDSLWFGWGKVRSRKDEFKEVKKDGSTNLKLIQDGIASPGPRSDNESRVALTVVTDRPHSPAPQDAVFLISPSESKSPEFTPTASVPGAAA